MLIRETILAKYWLPYASPYILMLVGNNLSDLDIDCGGIYSVGQHTVFVK